MTIRIRKNRKIFIPPYPTRIVKEIIREKEEFSCRDEHTRIFREGGI